MVLECILDSLDLCLDMLELLVHVDQELVLFALFAAIFAIALFVLFGVVIMRFIWLLHNNIYVRSY